MGTIFVFEQKYEKYQNFYLKIFIFLVVKFSIYLNRCVFVMKLHSVFLGSPIDNLTFLALSGLIQQMTNS